MTLPLYCDDDPDHPILDRPHIWELTEFTYRKDRQDAERSHTDLTFERDGVVRRLRFFAPQQLEISPEMPPNALGMCILDVSGRQLEGVRVRVGCFEHPYGCPRFWAGRVVDLDAPGGGGHPAAGGQAASETPGRPV